jgi:integrase
MLSDAQCRNASTQAKIRKLVDEQGLYLWVYPDGRKYWRLRYWQLGKEKSLSLGVYPEIGLKEARARRDAERKKLNSGLDPSSERKAKKLREKLSSENSFEAISREWHTSRSRAWTPKYTVSLIRRLEADIFKKIGHRPIAEITPPEMLATLRVIEARGAHDLAHRVQQVCGQIFTYAIVTGRAERNPVNDLRGALTPTVKKHNAYLRAEQLPEFLQKMNAYDGAQTRLAMKFLLLTFVRTGEMRGALWSEIDLKKAEWRIPAERMKMRDPHIVPLSTQALAVLEDLKPLTGHWEHVFPNQHRPKGQMSENTILYALYRMGYHGKSTGHGFRATASTILNEHGFKPDVIERQLAHAERNSIRKAYNHAQYLPERRKMMQWWADYLDSCAGNTKK